MSIGLNSVQVGGNLTRDPETRSTTNGNAVTAFGMANNRRYGGRETTTFLDVEAWGKTGELVQQYLRKGAGCIVEGRIEQDHWEDRQTGQKRSKLKVIANQVHFTDPRDASTDGDREQGRDSAWGNTPQQHVGQPQPPQRQDPPAPPFPADTDNGQGADADGNIDDIPF